MKGELQAKAPPASITLAQFLSAAALIGGFIGVVAWFDVVDFYHRHFFDTGPIVAANNVLRVVFVVIFAWLVYAPGAGVLAVIVTPDRRATLTPAERAVVSFGIGVGIWHVAMLILGVCGLYYRPLMAGICLVVLLASARHFADTAGAAWRALAAHFSQPLVEGATPPLIGGILVTVAAVWLLLLRGIFPGGGGDYYTHYFYYYLAVLENHGLTPNDVWYHYYYSRGSGLAFLGMLLTDPEAPALTTYPCVISAAVAITTLLRRMAPDSLWPAAVTIVYLFYYLVAFNPSGDGQFQKDHEEVAALVTLTVWALCMERYASPKPLRIMAAASAIAAAIVTQSIGVVLGLFVGLLTAWSLVRRRWSDMWGYGCIGAAITAAVLGMFVLGYLMTGLGSDQPLGLMLHFADFKRLDEWGVVPQIIAVAWIRENYLVWEPPLGWETLKELSDFMRLPLLWPFLAGPVFALITLQMSRAITGCALIAPRDAAGASAALKTVWRLAALVAMLIAIAVLLGRAQSVSFARLSSFFVPLTLLLTSAATVWALNWPLNARDDRLLRLLLPIFLTFATLISWEQQAKWKRQFDLASTSAMRFFIGRYSLAEAYTRANSGHQFGAIDPGVLAAARQLPYGTPIWSTNVDSYCMVPGCLIESVLSFKMSGRLDDILGDDPQLAKQRLQEAGINYFLFNKNYGLLDILPYSRLFAPETIDSYLGVKWTDGSTFLLTWKGSDTAPLGRDFLDDYTRLHGGPESTWFYFRELAPEIVSLAPRLRAATQWREVKELLTWSRAR